MPSQRFIVMLTIDLVISRLARAANSPNAILSSPSPCVCIKSLDSDILEIILRNICLRIIFSSGVGMLWQSAASVSRCRSYQWRNLSSALCNRKWFDQCCSLSDPYSERVNQVMPCRGVGLGVGKVQFRPIIRIVSIRVMSLDVIYLIIASLAWNNGNDKHVDYFSVSISTVWF